MSGTWYGNLNNRVMERYKSPKPEIGMPCTEYCYSDRHAYEIIEIKDSRHIVARRYDVERVDGNGMSDSQQYRYISNPDNHTVKLVFAQYGNGEWRERVGSRMTPNRWRLGVADEYYDYSF